MATDGDKIAAATLTARLLTQLSGAPIDADKIKKAIETYGEVLRQVAQINPHTGQPFTPDEIRRMRNQGPP